MSEKMYLLSEQDLKCLFHSAWDCMISESNVVEFIKAHEYHERTIAAIELDCREDLLAIADEIEESDVDGCVDWHHRIRKALGAKVVEGRA